MSIALLFALALAVETPPGAAPPDAAKAAKPAAPVKVAALPTDKVCKSETEGGKRIPTRTCRTRAEWEALEVGAREYMRDRRELAPTR